MTIDRGVWLNPDTLTGREVADLARRVEELGYSTLWVGETTGRDPFAQCAYLGAVTDTLRLASGIANVYHRHPGVMWQGANTVAEQTGCRFTLGLGVSSPVLVSKVRGLEYSKPLSYMRDYLDQIESCRYTSVDPTSPPPIVLAALGPKMLELAAERTSGAHPYNVTADHTAMAREIMGPEAGLYVEQKVMLTTDAELARETSAQVLKFYNRAPGYRKAWNGMGFSDDEIDDLAPRFLDAIVAWGDVDAIEARLAEHAEAGATHVCIHPLHPEKGQGRVGDEALVALAPGMP